MVMVIMAAVVRMIVPGPVVMVVMSAHGRVPQ